MSDGTGRELVATAPGTAELREYDVPEVEADQVRVESEYSSFKHGTGLRMYRADTRDNTAAFDWGKRLHRGPDRPSVPSSRSRQPDRRTRRRGGQRRDATRGR